MTSSLHHRSDKDALAKKQEQERLQIILNDLLKEEENKYCADCEAKGPRWASWNLGVFLCIRCAGIHRNLGVHVSKVKSVNLDTWTPEQVQSIRVFGNSVARAVYEAHLPDHFRRPQTDGSLETFIRAKYEQKRYCMKDWTPPKVDVRPLLAELEQMANRKKAVMTSSSGGGGGATPADHHKSSTSNTPNAPKLHSPASKRRGDQKAPRQPSGQKRASEKTENHVKAGQPDQKQSSNVNDLLELDMSPSKGVSSQIGPANSAATDLFSLAGVGNQSEFTAVFPNDQSATNNEAAAGSSADFAAFGEFSSAPLPALTNQNNNNNNVLPVDSSQSATNEQLLMDAVGNNLNEKKSKSDILALYGSSTSLGPSNSAFASNMGLSAPNFYGSASAISVSAAAGTPQPFGGGGGGFSSNLTGNALYNNGVVYNAGGTTTYNAGGTSIPAVSSAPPSLFGLGHHQQQYNQFSANQQTAPPYSATPVMTIGQPTPPHNVTPQFNNAAAFNPFGGGPGAVLGVSVAATAAAANQQTPLGGALIGLGGSGAGVLAPPIPGSASSTIGGGGGYHAADQSAHLQAVQNQLAALQLQKVQQRQQIQPQQQQQPSVAATAFVATTNTMANDLWQ